MLKQVMKDSAIYTVANGLFGIVHVGLFFWAGHYLDKAQMGAVEMVYSLILLIQLTVALEVSQAIGRFTADANEDDRRKLISSALWFSIIMHTAFVLAISPFAGPISRGLLGADGFGKLFVVGFVAAACWSIYYHVRNQLRWLLMSKAYTVGMFVYVALAGGVGVTLLLRPDWAIYAILIAIIVASLPPVLMGVWRFRRELRPTISRTHLKEMLAFSLPLVPSSVAVFLAHYFDRLALAQIRGLEDVGLYGMGSKLAMLVYMGVVGFQGAVTPLIYHKYRDAETPGQLDRIFRWFLWLSLSMLLGTAVFAPEVARLLFPKFQAGVVVVPFLAFAAILSQIYIFSPGLALAKKTRLIAAIYIGGAILNVALNLALIPFMGILGAALATCLSAALTAAVYLHVSQRDYAIPFRGVRIVAALAIVTVVCVAMSRLTATGEGSIGFWLLAGLKLPALWAGMAGLMFVLIEADQRCALRTWLGQKCRRLTGRP